jgi:hypothetical protein
MAWGKTIFGKGGRGDKNCQCPFSSCSDIYLTEIYGQSSWWQPFPRLECLACLFFSYFVERHERRWSKQQKKYLIGAQFNKSFTVCYFTDKLVSYCPTFARNALAYPVCAPLNWVPFHPAKSRTEPNVFVKVKRTSLFRKNINYCR